MIALADLLEAMAPAGARLIGGAASANFEGFAYDSRKLRPGEIFLAVRTARADGHEFIADAVRRGATAVVGDRLSTDVALAHAAGMVAILVLSGATSAADLMQSDIRPSHVVAGVAQIIPAVTHVASSEVLRG